MTANDRSAEATVRVFSGGKVTVPAPIRYRLDIEDGDLVEITVRPLEVDE